MESVSSLNIILIRKELAEGSLVPVMTEHIGDALPVHVVWTSGKRVPPKLRGFIDWMVARLERYHRNVWSAEPRAASSPLRLVEVNPPCAAESGRSAVTTPSVRAQGAQPQDEM